MTDNKHPLLRKKTVANIIDCNPRNIVKATKFNGQLNITLKDDNHSISWHDAEKIYVDILKQESRNARIQKTTDTCYKVKLKNDRKSYTVCGKNLTCTCYEYRQQKPHYSAHCCSHGYAVLGTLGYSDLKSYLKKKENKIVPLKEFQIPKVTNSSELIAVESALVS